MQKDISITCYDAICNLGNNIDEIFENALNKNCNRLKKANFGIESFYGFLDVDLPEISEENYNTRCNQILLYLLNNMAKSIDELLNKYSSSRIGVVVATTNTGVEDYVLTGNLHHCQLGNPAQFIKKHLKLGGYCQSVSTACSSGIKAFSCAQRAMNAGLIDAAIVAASEALTKVPIYGFNSMEVLSDKKNIPFSANRKGINIGEGGGIFILEKSSEGLLIKGIGETTDAYHQTSPDVNGVQAEKAINIALKQANISSSDIAYVNLHGTGTISNDSMEANVINRVFKNNVPVSSTKSLTGHCLGASAIIETALCCHCIEKQYVLPHYYDDDYDENLPDINLATQKISSKEIKNVMCNAFGFGGTNAVIIVGKER